MSDLDKFRQDAIDVIRSLWDNAPSAQHLSAMFDCEDAIRALPFKESEQDREFIKLMVRNLNGRPYYSIIYLEVDDNGVGHDFEGYSSYSLDVISDYLKKYFMSHTGSE